MLENGYIKYVRITSSFNEKGNPISETEEESDFVSANIQGTANLHLQTQVNNYEKVQYVVVTNFLPEIYSDNIILFDKEKNEIGRFQVKSKKISCMFNSFSLTV